MGKRCYMISPIIYHKITVVWRIPRVLCNTITSLLGTHNTTSLFCPCCFLLNSDAVGIIATNFMDCCYHLCNLGIRLLLIFLGKGYTKWYLGTPWPGRTGVGERFLEKAMFQPVLTPHQKMGESRCLESMDGTCLGHRASHKALATV